MGNSKKYKIITVLILLILTGSISYYFGSKNFAKNGDLFVWNPPQDTLTSPSTNITNSATCRFAKSFNTFFMKKITNSELNPPERVYYDFGEDNQTDTVTFSDLNTDHPKVVTNTGQSDLTVLNNNSDTITLIDLTGINDPIGHAFSVYKLFKKKGVLVYTGATDSFFTLGPTGTLEMGYCN